MQTGDPGGWIQHKPSPMDSTVGLRILDSAPKRPSLRRDSEPSPHWRLSRSQRWGPSASAADAAGGSIATALTPIATAPNHSLRSGSDRSKRRLWPLAPIMAPAHPRFAMAPESPAPILPGTTVVVNDARSIYNGYRGFVQRISGRRAAVLFEGGNWDKLITVPLTTLQAVG